MKRISYSLLLILLWSNLACPAIDLNAYMPLGKKLFPWMVGLYCLYATYKWEANFRKSKKIEDEKEALERKNKPLNDTLLKAQRSVEICNKLGIAEDARADHGIININPSEVVVTIAGPGLVYKPGTSNSELEIHAEDCPEKLHANMYLKDQKTGGDLKPFPLLRRSAFVLTKEWFNLSEAHLSLLRYGF